MSNNIHNIFLKGVYTALITPFNSDTSIDFVALKELVEWQIANGVQGLVPAGTTGESPTLSHEEHSKVLKAVIEQTNGRVPVIAGTGSNNTAEAISLSNEALKLGATATLQVCPYYNKPSQEGLYRHFSTIAEKTAIPQVLYNIPGRSGIAIELPTICKLLKNPLIIAIKDATGNITNTMNLIHEMQLFKSDKTSKKNISILSGDDNLALATIAAGGHGVISVISNVIPAQMVELIQLALSNKTEDAKNLFYTLYPLFKLAFLETNPIPVKYMTSQLTLCKEYYRLPMCELHQENKNKIDTVLKAFIK